MTTKKSTGPMLICTLGSTSTTIWYPMSEPIFNSEEADSADDAEVEPAYRATSMPEDEDSWDTEGGTWTTTEATAFGSDWPDFTNKRFKRFGFTEHVGHGPLSED